VRQINVIDKAVSYFSPEKGLRRYAARQTLKILNTGYSESGGSVRKKSMKGWTPWSSSPQADIDMNLSTLRNRSRDLFMSGALGRSPIVTVRTNVVGAGLRLKSRIDHEFLGLTQEQADEWEKQTEREFDVWADSKHCDATKVNNFYEMQSIMLISTLLNGDGWVAIKQDKPQPYFPYSLRIHPFEGDRVSTPYEVSGGVIRYTFVTSVMGKNLDNGNRIINGVEIDPNGAIVAYWVSNGYPYDPANIYGEMLKWDRIEAFGALTGQQNILQIMDTERCEQYRGVPYLAPVLESIKQISRYTEAELTAAIITGFFTVFIKEGETSSSDFSVAEAIPKEEKIDLDPNSLELGAGTINSLPPGYDVQFGDPTRPSGNFDAFVTALSRHIGAALEIPYELLLKSFTASYSASRAALLEAWKAFKMRRTWFASDFCQPVYQIWLSEAIARGRIKAPGYFNDPLVARAWSRSEWYGPSQGQLDPVREVQAAKMRVENGFSTRERETIELTGGDFDRNIAQLQRENDLMKQDGLVQPQPVKIVQDKTEGGNN
jgi:phage portal protein, lambda family